MSRCQATLYAFTVLGLLLTGPVADGVRAQTTRGTVVAQFGEAEAMTVDPKGRMYVADAGRDVIITFEPRDGTMGRTGSIGGPGTRAGEFDGPVDIDPTNGLTLFVADAGNGRLQRFSEEGQFLEALPIGPSLRSGAERRSFQDGRDGSEVQGDGRPVAVATTNSNDIFVIDARDGVVVKFGPQRRFEGEIGTAFGRPGTLREPVALAVGADRRLYVADRGAEAVLMYDLYGTFVRTLQIPPVPSVSALRWVRDRLWIVSSDQVFVWDPASRTIRTRSLELGAPVVDAVRHNGDLYLLTPTRLLRRDDW